MTGIEPYQPLDISKFHLVNRLFVVVTTEGTYPIGGMIFTDRKEALKLKKEQQEIYDKAREKRPIRTKHHFTFEVITLQAFIERFWKNDRS